MKDVNRAAPGEHSADGSQGSMVLFSGKWFLHILFMGDGIVNNFEYFPFLSSVPTLETSLCLKGNSAQQ